MNISSNANAAAIAATAKTQGEGNASNPAKLAKAADPAVKGAEFGALVSQFAHARNAAKHAAKHGAPPAPVDEPPPAAVTPPEPTVDIVV
jgi:hypothetical protein